MQWGTQVSAGRRGLPGSLASLRLDPQLPSSYHIAEPAHHELPVYCTVPRRVPMPAPQSRPSLVPCDHHSRDTLACPRHPEPPPSSASTAIHSSHSKQLVTFRDIRDCSCPCSRDASPDLARKVQASAQPAGGLASRTRAHHLLTYKSCLFLPSG